MRYDLYQKQEAHGDFYSTIHRPGLIVNGDFRNKSRKSIPRVMDQYLLIVAIFLSVGILLLFLGKMNVVSKKIHIPLFLSSVIFTGFYFIKIFHKFAMPLLGFSEKTNNLLFNDYGLGLIGLLPLALILLLVGKYLIKMSYHEQWNGTINFDLPSLKYGIIAGVSIASVPLIISALTGHKFDHEIDIYKYGVNAVTNLYEEIIFRGLLLAACVKYWNRLFAVIWTSAVFGLGHGVNEKSILIGLGSCLMAWAVLRARSLWAGWTSHQLADMIVDTFLP